MSRAEYGARTQDSDAPRHLGRVFCVCGGRDLGKGRWRGLDKCRFGGSENLSFQGVKWQWRGHVNRGHRSGGVGPGRGTGPGAPHTKLSQAPRGPRAVCGSI